MVTCSRARCDHLMFAYGHCLVWNCPNHIRKCDEHRDKDGK